MIADGKITVDGAEKLLEVMDSINKSMDERGMVFEVNNIKKKDIELLIESLADMEVNVDQ